jgi:hypothetical protein
MLGWVDHLALARHYCQNIVVARFRVECIADQSLDFAVQLSLQANECHLQPWSELVMQLVPFALIVPGGLDLLLPPFQVKPRKLRDGGVKRGLRQW